MTDPEKSKDEVATLIPPTNADPTPTLNSFQRYMKWVSLFLLVAQNAALALLTRWARTREGGQFVSTTAVVMSEFFKLVACLFLVLHEHNFNLRRWAAHLYELLLVNWKDTLKVAVPAFVYMVQNNLLYVAITNLPAATFQVTYQCKLLTTACFSVSLLNKQLKMKQWWSLLVLFVGIAAVQVANATGDGESKQAEGQNQVFGIIAVLSACCCSGFAGVYFEKILKGSKVSLWTRNIQLGLFGFLTGLIGAYSKDGDKIAANGDFFYGYTPIVWSAICCQAFGGLLVAVVIKYADNILKGFACSISIIVSAVFAMILFDFAISGLFVVGTALVCVAVYMYST